MLISAYLRVRRYARHEVVSWNRAWICACCRGACLSTADSTGDPVSVLTDTTSSGIPNLSLSWTFSVASVDERSCKIWFSSIRSLFSSSSAWSASSSCSIFIFLRSRAVWAATRFFSFLKIQQDELLTLNAMDYPIQIGYHCQLIKQGLYRSTHI